MTCRSVLVLVWVGVAVMVRTGAMAQQQHCRRNKIDSQQPGCQSFSLTSPGPNQKCLVSDTTSPNLSFYLKPGPSFRQLLFAVRRKTDVNYYIQKWVYNGTRSIVFGHHQLSDSEKWYHIQLKEMNNHISNTYRAYIDNEQMDSIHLYLNKGDKVEVYTDGLLPEYAPTCNPAQYLTTSPPVSNVMVWTVMIVLLILLLLVLLTGAVLIRQRQSRTKEEDKMKLAQSCLPPEAPQQQETTFTNHHNQKPHSRYQKIDPTLPPPPLPQCLPGASANSMEDNNSFIHHIYEQVNPVMYRVPTGAAGDGGIVYVRENSLYVPSGDLFNLPQETNDQETEQTSAGRVTEQTSAGRGTEQTSAGRGTEQTSAGRGTEQTSAGRGTEQTSAGRGTEQTERSSSSNNNNNGGETEHTRHFSLRN
ncbi:hypothetical protein Pmani_032281 [Petrolisthes manimaculis]|uniref:Uncharacterized protein n=1 Tax=Petrolisthes manimaculis TaxID=1843537 RepID=A0AAE1NTF6_9EUCA|nr:hypothetical protein Pmani_032281 [Petrolisthes manimaculis]